MPKTVKLNKEVCKHCMSIQCVASNITGVLRDPVPWHDNGEQGETSDEVLWNKGRVACPSSVAAVSNTEIPDWCLYEFEHMVAAGMTETANVCSGRRGD